MDRRRNLFKWDTKRLMLFYGFSLLFVADAIGQKSDLTSTIVGVKTQVNFIIPHSPDLRKIADTYPLGFQVEWSRLNLSQNAWEQCNCYSKVGLSFAYFNYRNPSQLGNSYNLILFAEPLLTFKRDFFVSFRPGAGITYLDQVYDEESNPANTFYSSPISFIVLLNLALNYKLAESWQINLTAHYNHISNGGIKQPNKGMNFPGLGLGVDYIIKPIAMAEREKVSIEKGRILAYGRLFATRKTKSATEDDPEKSKLLFGIAGGAKTRVANFNAVSAGLELIRDNTLSEVSGKKRKAPYVLGAGIGHHFIFGRFNFNQQMIYYLYKPYNFTDKKFYQRYELAYQINQYLLVGVSLKAHGHVAENFDLRVGVVF